MSRMPCDDYLRYSAAGLLPAEGDPRQNGVPVGRNEVDRRHRVQHTDRRSAHAADHGDVDLRMDKVSGHHRNESAEDRHTQCDEGDEGLKVVLLYTYTTKLIQSPTEIGPAYNCPTVG